MRAEDEIIDLRPTARLHENMVAVAEGWRHTVAANSDTQSLTDQPQEEIADPRTTNGPPTRMDDPLTHDDEPQDAV